MTLTTTQAMFSHLQITPVIAAGSPWGPHAAPLVQGHLPGYVQLAWQSVQPDDRHVQVYVDGRLVAVAENKGDQRLWLQVDPAIGHEVQLLAVDPNRTTRPQPLPIRSSASTDVTIRRDESWPIDTQIRLTIDGQPAGSLAFWSPLQPRSGFGGLFGQGRFGFDDAAGLGLGRGELGRGPLGSDSTDWRYRHHQLTGQEHSLGLQAIDRQRQAISQPSLLTRSIERPAAPPTDLICDSDFTWRWSKANA